MDINTMKEVKSCTLNPEDVDDREGPFLMSFAFDLSPLTRSIENIGLLNQPLVIRGKAGKVDVVTGYRRILALKALKRNEIPCKDLSGCGLSRFDLVLLALYDNLATRKLNMIEKGMVLVRLASHIKLDKILEYYMPLLDLPSHEPTLRSLMRIEQKLDRRIKESIATGNLSLQAAKMLLEVRSDLRGTIFELISKLRYNLNQQVQLIDFILDISSISNTSIAQILSDCKVDEICMDNKLNNPQKASAVLQILRAKRYPVLARSETLFKKQVSSLDLPEGVRISAPRDFEAPHYRLEVTFNEGGDLKEKIDLLCRNEELKHLKDPWEKRA